MNHMLPKVPSICNSMFKESDIFCIPEIIITFHRNTPKCHGCSNSFQEPPFSKGIWRQRSQIWSLSSYFRHAPNIPFFLFPICKMRIMKSDLCSSHSILYDIVIFCFLQHDGSMQRDFYYLVKSYTTHV